MTVMSCAARAGNVALFLSPCPRRSWAIVRRSCEQVSRPGARSGPRSGDGHARLTWPLSPNRGALGVRVTPAARGFWAAGPAGRETPRAKRRASSIDRRSPCAGRRRFLRRTNALDVHAVVTRSRSMLSIIAAYRLYVGTAPPAAVSRASPLVRACRRAGENILLGRRRAPLVRAVSAAATMACCNRPGVLLFARRSRHGDASGMSSLRCWHCMETRLNQRSECSH